jgi:tRNA-specific 2-thiouridylase
MSQVGHPAAQAKSSQDLCFTGGRAPHALVAERAPAAARPGPIVDASGRRLGTHKGLAWYTIGQRKGIGVAWTEPLYVVGLRAETNEVVVGPEGALARTSFDVDGVRWLEAPAGRSTSALVQIRYRTGPVPGRVSTGGDRLATVVLERPAAAIAPGQCAVFYEGDRVLGGGWIVG